MHRFASGETDIERDTRLAIDAEVRRAQPPLALETFQPLRMDDPRSM